MFLNTRDYERFASGLYYFNDINFIPDIYHCLDRPQVQGLTLEESDNRRELVDITAWCLVPTHYHLVLRQKIEDGVTKFMRRLGTGYTMYVNQKYERSGHIFHGSFQGRFINKDRYLQHVIRYVHLNPLDLYDAAWRTGKTKDLEASKKFVLEYPWSSLGDYIGSERLPQLLSSVRREVVSHGPHEYAEFLWEWLTAGVPTDPVVARIFQGQTLD